MPPTVDAHVEEEEKEKEVLDGGNILFHCILHEDLDRLMHVFSDASNPYHEHVSSLINTRNDLGKTPLEMACVLGRADMLRELVKHGADLELTNYSGYHPMHFSACWGHRSCLEALVHLGAKVETRTVRGETPKQIALRYNHKECVEFIDWAAAKFTLIACIAHVRELVSDPEKHQGVKLTKEEKSGAIASCNEKQEWLDTVENATFEDFMMKKADLDKQVEAILHKENSPAPPTGSSGKK